MLLYGIRIARTAVRLAWLGATGGVLALAAMPHLLPYVGREMYVVRGASMEPAIPIGSVVVIGHVEPKAVAIGDIVTFRAQNDAVVTHRVVGVASDAEIAFQTKGDGSSATDPILVPAHSVIGRVETYVPGIGAIVAMLSSTVGAAAALGLLAGLLLSMKFMDELLAAVGRGARRRAALTEPAH